MATTAEQLQKWMGGEENEHLEFKEARNSFEFDNLARYCVALANEGGGRFVLGVTDKRPRRVVGTQAFVSLGRTKAGLMERLRLRVDVEELDHPDGRVLVFAVPARPAGVPLHDRGTYWMRSGESLVPMTAEMLRRVFEETGPDYSAETCAGAVLGDLDANAIGRFQEMWARRSGNKGLLTLGAEQLLTDAELLVDGNVTYAALVLLGTNTALGRYLSQAEVIFEYRASEASVAAHQRNEYREGFLLFLDDLWSTINLRNDVQQFHDGLFVRDIATFNETVVREAILNSVAHRDYRLPGSIFVRQFPRKLEVVSPGGFLPGITPETVLWRQAPRNRRIAEACARCGLVERSGQGVDRMFQESIRESKPRPSFAGTDDYQVFLTLRGEVQDPSFLRFLEQIGEQALVSFSTEDFLVLDMLHQEQLVPDFLRARLPALVNQGVVEKLGRGRGVRYILSRRFYAFLGERGAYTRTRGLDHAHNKQLLAGHIRNCAEDGCQLGELMQVLPALSRGQVQGLLKELKAEGRIHSIGRTSAARWYPSS